MIMGRIACALLLFVPFLLAKAASLKGNCVSCTNKAFIHCIHQFAPKNEVLIFF